MDRSQKSELISDIKEKFSNSSSFVLVDFRGMKNSELTDFRNNLRKNKISLKIIKNTLIKIAIKDSNLKLLDSYLSGPTAVIYGNDIIALSKILIKIITDNDNIKFTAGFYNDSIINQSDIEKLSKLKSIEELRASFVALLNGAQSNFITLINAPASKTVTLLNNYLDSK